MNYIYLLPLFLISFISILVYFLNEKNNNHLKQVANGLFLDGREVASLIISNEELKLILNQTNAKESEYYDVKYSILYLPDYILNKQSVYSLSSTIKEIATIIALKDSYLIKNLIEAFIVVFSTIGYILLAYSLVFQDSGVYFFSLILIASSILVSFASVVIEYIVKNKALNLILKYNMVESDKELEYVNKFLKYNILKVFILMSLPIVEIVKYIKESF